MHQSAQKSSANKSSSGQTNSPKVAPRVVTPVPANDTASFGPRFADIPVRSPAPSVSSPVYPALKISPPPAASSPAPVIQRKFILEPDRDAAKKQLNANYPNLNIFANSIDQKGDEFWERHLKGQSLDAFLVELLQKCPLVPNRSNPIKIHMTQEEGGKVIRVQIAVRKDGTQMQHLHLPENQVFTLNYAFIENERGDLQTKLETIDAKKADKDAAKQFISGALLPQFDRLNVKAIHLKASGIGSGRDGIFVWARYGFVPNQEAWGKMRAKGLETMEAHKDKSWYSEVKGYVGSSDPRALRNLVYLAWQHKGDVTTFVNAVLEADIGGWEGSLDLTNPSDKAWISKYANQGSVAYAEYANLLDQYQAQPENKIVTTTSGQFEIK